MPTTDAATTGCPKCGAARNKFPDSDSFSCGSKIVWNSFERQYRTEHTQTCEILKLQATVTRLEAALLKLDRMASQQLAHGVVAVKPFAREVFDVCEIALKVKEKNDAALAAAGRNGGA